MNCYEFILADANTNDLAVSRNEIIALMGFAPLLRYRCICFASGYIRLRNAYEEMNER